MDINYKLVYKAAWKYQGNLEFDDAVQCASIGMLKALKRFDPSKGALFTTFAFKCMHNEMYNTQKKVAKDTHYVYKSLNEIYTQEADHNPEELQDIIPDGKLLIDTKVTDNLEIRRLLEALREENEHVYKLFTDYEYAQNYTRACRNFTKHAVLSWLYYNVTHDKYKPFRYVKRWNAYYKELKEEMNRRK